VPLAHRCEAGQRGDAAVALGVVDHAPLRVPQPVALGHLGGELGAELGLVRGSAQEQDEVAGDGQREVPSEVVLDQGQRQVHAGGDAGRGVHVAVAHEDRVGVHLNGRERVGEEVAHRPVGGGPAAVEQTGPGQQEGA
jgi:hypothetical protein